jgi:hypothetical protein
MNKELIYRLFLLIVITSSLLTIFINKENVIEEKVDVKKEVNEKIPLYYNLDNPEIIYTKDDNYNFIEVKLNE